jgi:hypothetical protein
MPAFPATGMPVPEVWAKDGIDGILQSLKNW